MPGYTGNNTDEVDEVDDDAITRAINELNQAYDFEQNMTMRHTQMRAQNAQPRIQHCQMCGRHYATNVIHDCNPARLMGTAGAIGGGGMANAPTRSPHQEFYDTVFTDFVQKVMTPEPEVQLCEGVGTLYELAPIDRVSPKAYVQVGSNPLGPIR